MTRRAKLAIAVLFFVLLGWLYINTGRVPGGAPQLEYKLARAAGEALGRAEQQNWARVDMHGRVAVVSGLAPDEHARDAALEAVRAAAPRGGVARVIDSTDLQSVASPYTFEGVLDDSRLMLSGYAPDRGTRDAIAARAARVFAGEVDASGVEIASGAPEGSDWLGAVDFAVSELVRLRRGVLWIEDTEITIDGLGGSPEVRAEIARQLRQAPAPFTGRARIEVVYTGEETAEELAEDDAGPSGVGPDGGTPAARAACQSRIDELLAADSIGFSFNAADISADSDGLLDEVATVAQGCEPLRLMVGGHTDSTGDPDFNVYLSERRAHAVAEDLVRRGVDPARIVAEGFGSSRPIASNDSAAGRAQNRRIEITVMEPADAESPDTGP